MSTQKQTFFNINKKTNIHQYVSLKDVACYSQLIDEIISLLQRDKCGLTQPPLSKTLKQAYLRQLLHYTQLIYGGSKQRSITSAQRGLGRGNQ